MQKALFGALINSDNINADNINNLISNIIQSPIPKQNMKLDDIPRQLIGVHRFHLKMIIIILVNQIDIFIGCNTPNLLQSLKIISISKIFKFGY